LTWAINYPSRLKRLVYLQKRIIRLIAGVRLDFTLHYKIYSKAKRDLSDNYTEKSTLVGVTYKDLPIEKYNIIIII